MEDDVRLAVLYDRIEEELIYKSIQQKTNGNFFVDADDVIEIYKRFLIEEVNNAST